MAIGSALLDWQSPEVMRREEPALGAGFPGPLICNYKSQIFLGGDYLLDKCISLVYILPKSH
jgi:hypothetical protein